jgi:hypothetical protein
MNGAIAIRRDPHAGLLPSPAPLATELLPSGPGHLAKSLETVRGLRTRTRWKKAVQRVRTFTRLPTVVETAGIEPASATACKEASTSLVGASVSPPGVRADRHVREASPLNVPEAARADRFEQARYMKPEPSPTGRGEADSRLLN